MLGPVEQVGDERLQVRQVGMSGRAPQERARSRLKTGIGRAALFGRQKAEDAEDPEISL
jgi:hypothetical protein